MGYPYFGKPDINIAVELDASTSTDVNVIHTYNHYVNANMQNSPQFSSRKTYGKLEEICIFTREPPEISSAGHLWNLWVQLFLWKLIVQGGSLAVRSSLDTQMAGTVDPR